MDALTDEILKAIRPAVLKAVTKALEGKEVKVTTSENNDGEYEIKKKKTVDFTKNPVCVMVTSYTPKSNALFGDFKKRYESFKDEVMKVKKDIFKPNGKLQFGFGWTFEKSKTADVEKMLKKHKVEFRKVTHEDYMKEIFGDDENTNQSDTEKPKKSKKAASVEVDEDDEKPPRKLPSKKATEKKKAKESDSEEVEEKKTKKSTGELELEKNAWGNMEEENTLISFHKLPVGAKGKEVYVAVGYQDQDEPKSKKGISSLLPLTTDLEEVCQEKEWKYLTEDMLSKISDKELKKQLKLLREKIPQEEESEAEIEEDESEEEADDEEDDE